ncbi:MAG: hypothetical protein IJ091_04810 [Oscillospiraceae bacterium]|nr:hypothetical protein [Oscillospiraceae bacterium]
MGKAKETMSGAVNTVSAGVTAASKHPKFKKYLIIGLAALACIAAVFALISNMGKTVDLGKYVVVTYDGYDEYGTATASLDWEALFKKYGDNITYTRKAKGMAQKTSAMEYLMTVVSYKVDKTSDLSNGEEIHVTFTVPSNINEILKCKIKADDLTIKVKGLEALTEIDPFADLTVTFSGVDGEGTAEYSYSGFGLGTRDFSIDNSYDLSEGQTVKITVDEYSIEWLAKDYGLKPTVTEKEYTVEGLGHYLASASELSDKDKTTIEENAQYWVNDYINSNWSLNKVKLISTTAVGNYVQVAKDASTWPVSEYAVVFKILSQISGENDTTENVTQYMSVSYRNIVINSDGTATFYADDHTLSSNNFRVEVKYGDSFWEYNSYYYRGYTNVNDLKDGEVIRDTDRYDYEWNVSEAA